MIRCPVCDAMEFDRVKGDQWLCGFCGYTKGRRNHKIIVKGDMING